MKAWSPKDVVTPDKMSAGELAVMTPTESYEAASRARADIRAEIIERARQTMDAAMRPGKRAAPWEKGKKGGSNHGGMPKVYYLARRVLAGGHAYDRAAAGATAGGGCGGGRAPLRKAGKGDGSRYRMFAELAAE
jgi:hypothetical protein